MKIRLKRVYAPAAPEDGYRVLVDRLWPRGLAKERAALDEWLPELAPSTGLRRWFAHDQKKWTEFKRRYAQELAAPAAEAILARLRASARKGQLTLLYAARDEGQNNAVALLEHLESARRRRSPAKRGRRGGP